MQNQMTSESGSGLVTMITQLSKALHRRTSEELLGMRLKEFLTLSYIRDHENVTQQELEAALMVDANAVVLLLNDLESAGHLVRRRDPADRRRHLVEVTRSGRTALERAETAREALERELLAGLSQQERDSLMRLLHQVLDRLLSASPEQVRS
jgi:DNA-binding MarR family transcriptional regulator